MSIDSSNSQCVICKFKAGCFDGLSSTQLAEVSESKLKINFKKGETIRKQGSFTRGVLYLSKGFAKVYKEIEEIDQNSIVAIYKPGQMIGLSSLFTSKTAQFTVVAMTDCTVCCIEIETFQRLMHENINFAIDIIKSINEQNSLLFDFQISNNHKQLHGRLAEAILYLKQYVFNSNSFDVPLSRRELAEYTNMSTMSVVRILKSFKDDEIVEDKNGHIHIMNFEKLKRISRIG
jgi:CRP/FNR family transcriptional regulator